MAKNSTPLPNSSNSDSNPGQNQIQNQVKDSGALHHLWMSPWTVWIGLRYLKSKKNSRFLSFITLLSICGVGLGVSAMIVVLSVMGGFESELKKRMMSSDLHILVQPTVQTQGFDSGFAPVDSLPASQLEAWKKDFDDQIEHVWPIVSTEAILKAGHRVTGVVVKGVTQDRLDVLIKQVVESADAQLQLGKESGQKDSSEKSGEKSAAKSDGKSDSQASGSNESEGKGQIPGIYMGQELAYEMGLISGDQVTLISPTEMEGPLSGVPRFKRYRIEGIYHSGLPEQELHTVFAKQGAVWSFLRKANILSQWEVAVKDFDRAPEIGNRLRTLAPHLKVEDWIQLNSHLFASLRLERISMFVILTFIIIVASFNIVTTLTLMVLEKKKDISILKAMGARQGQLAAVFLAEGMLIGILGIGGGIGLALLVCTLLRRYEFIALPDIYYDRTLPVTFDPLCYVLVGTSALVIVIIACLYPSRRAAKLNPLDGIRFG